MAARKLATVRVGGASHGQGVYAARRLRAGALIGEVTGEIIDDWNYTSDYCIDLGESLSLEPGPPFRFLNHSCEPNAELLQGPNGDPTDDLRMWVYALRTIAPGEEITIDYAWPAEAAIRCLCGSPVCRGWIVDPAELDDVLRRAAGQRRRKSQRR